MAGSRPVRGHAALAIENRHQRERHGLHLPAARALLRKDEDNGDDAQIMAGLWVLTVSASPTRDLRTGALLPLLCL